MSDLICEIAGLDIFRKWVLDVYGIEVAKHLDSTLMTKSLSHELNANYDLMLALQQALNYVLPSESAVDEAIRAEHFLSE
jgi:hypothetical protein